MMRVQQGPPGTGQVFTAKAKSGAHKLTEKKSQQESTQPAQQQRVLGIEVPPKRTVDADDKDE